MGLFQRLGVRSMGCFFLNPECFDGDIVSIGIKTADRDESLKVKKNFKLKN